MKGFLNEEKDLVNFCENSGAWNNLIISMSQAVKSDNVEEVEILQQRIRETGSYELCTFVS